MEDLVILMIFVLFGLACSVSLNVSDGKAISLNGTPTRRAKQLLSDNSWFEKKVKRMRKITASSARQLQSPIGSQPAVPFVIENSSYVASMPNTSSCTSRNDVLRENQALITAQHNTVLEYTFQLLDCIEANNKFNAQRIGLRHSIEKKLKPLTRRMYVIATDVEQLAPFQLQHILFNRSTLPYCTSASSSADFTARLSNVVRSLDNFLKVFLNSSVVLFRTSCGRRQTILSKSPTLERDCASPWPVVVGVVTLIVVALVAVLIFVLSRRPWTRRMHQSFDYYESNGTQREDVLMLVRLKSAAKKCSLVQRAMSV